MTDTAGHGPGAVNRRGRRSAIWLLSFLYIWLMVGFFLGTAVLIGPIRWLTAGIQRAGWPQTGENAIVIVSVGLYVIASFLIARRLNRFVLRTTSRRTAAVVPAVVTFAALAAAYAWMNPATMLSGLAGARESTVQTSTGAVFEFGAYPDRERLQQLQQKGITTVISLQHPSVLVERKLITDEVDNARQLHMNLVHAPMLPWFSENRASLDTIRALAASGKGHYYVHCGLGRDRVNIVKKLVEGLGATTRVARDFSEGLGFEERTVPLARGPVVRLAPGVWMVPYPDHEEMYGCFLEGSPGKVVLLLDPDEPRDKEMLGDAARVFAPYAFRYTHIPISRASPPTLLAAADSAARIPPPVTLVVAATAGLGENGIQNPGWEVAEAIKAAYPNSARRFAGRRAAYKPRREARGEYDTRTGC